MRHYGLAGTSRTAGQICAKLGRVKQRLQGFRDATFSLPAVPGRPATVVTGAELLGPDYLGFIDVGEICMVDPAFPITPETTDAPELDVFLDMIEAQMPAVPTWAWWAIGAGVVGLVGFLWWGSR